MIAELRKRSRPRPCSCPVSSNLPKLESHIFQQVTGLLRWFDGPLDTLLWGLAPPIIKSLWLGFFSVRFRVGGVGVFLRPRRMAPDYAKTPDTRPDG